MNPIITSLLERKSVRSFEDRPVPEDLRDLIVEAALQAPTAGNQTLYTILDIRDQPIKNRLAVLCDNQPFIATAPMVHIFLSDCRRWLSIFRTAGIEPRDPEVGDLMIALADGLIASQNAVTAAWSLGIGSCYIGDVLERREELTELLALKPFLVPAAMVVYGFPTAQQMDRPKPPRFSRDLIVQRDRYADPDPVRLEGEVTRKNGARSPTSSFTAFVRAFHDRKYASDFARELNRSATLYVKDFLQ
jgi:nitroreductase